MPSLNVVSPSRVERQEGMRLAGNHVLGIT
jgi:hypothetical protein